MRMLFALFLGVLLLATPTLAQTDDTARRRLAVEMLTAADSGDLAAINRGLAAGLDPNVGESVDKTTLIIRAANRGHTHVVQRLIEAGADVNRADNGGCTALDLAMARLNTLAEALLRNAGAKEGRGCRISTDEQKL